jgi:hypothetical protein
MKMPFEDLGILQGPNKFTDCFNTHIPSFPLLALDRRPFPGRPDEEDVNAAIWIRSAPTFYLKSGFPVGDGNNLFKLILVN